MKNIFIGLIFGIILFQGYINEFCLAHPTGHKHHHHIAGKPSLCELRKQFKGTAYWPPMDCKHINIYTDSYQQSQKEQIRPNILTLVFVAANFEHL